MENLEIKDGVAIIPEGTTKIEGCSFENCTELTSVVIPASVEYIQPGAFLGCPKLEEVIFAEKVDRIDVKTSHCSKITLHKPFDGVAKLLRDGYAVDLDPRSRWSFWD